CARRERDYAMDYW
nr:immunoglobulin heavy chain junction region [Mus musculus]